MYQYLLHPKHHLAKLWHESFRSLVKPKALMYKRMLLFCSIIAVHNFAHASQEHKSPIQQPKGILKQSSAAQHIKKNVAFELPTDLTKKKPEESKRKPQKKLAMIKPVSISTPDDVQDALGDTALIAASRAGWLDLVKNLIAKKANLEMKNFNSPPRTALCEAAACGKLSIVRFLVGQKALINYENKKDRNPLSFAIASLHTTQLLLEKKANVDAQDEEGNTALHLAVMHEQSAVAYLLLQHSATRKITNIYGLMPMDYVKRNKANEQFFEQLVPQITL